MFRKFYLKNVERNMVIFFVIWELCLINVIIKVNVLLIIYLDIWYRILLIIIKICS